MNIFAIVKKLINSNPNKPLNALIEEQYGQSGVKLVQRGVTSQAQTVTISPVDMGKTFVVSVSKGSSGYAGITGTIRIPESDSSDGSWGSNITVISTNGTWVSGQVWPRVIAGGSFSADMPAKSYSITAGSTNLAVGKYSAKLTGATTLYCDGACEWQVVEFY